MEVDTMLTVGNNKDNTKTLKSQAGKLLDKAEEERKKLDNANADEAKQIYESADKLEEEVDADLKRVEEALAKALAEYQRSDAKVNAFLQEAEELVRASKEAKATTEALISRINAIEINMSAMKKQIDKEIKESKAWREEISKKLAWLELLVYITAGASIIAGALAWIR